ADHEAIGTLGKGRNRDRRLDGAGREHGIAAAHRFDRTHRRTGRIDHGGTRSHICRGRCGGGRRGRLSGLREGGQGQTSRTGQGENQIFHFTLLKRRNRHTSSIPSHSIDKGLSSLFRQSTGWAVISLGSAVRYFVALEHSL